MNVHAQPVPSTQTVDAWHGWPGGLDPHAASMPTFASDALNATLDATKQIRLMASWVDHVGAQLRAVYIESTRALVAAVEAKDIGTEEHSQRVSRNARGIADRMGLPDSDRDCIATAAMLHDIGKIGVPDAILAKPDVLTAEEFALVQRHPAIAIEILGHTTFLNAELALILHHHERFDGSGYPSRLARRAIPLGARVLTIADSIDAMLSDRPYRPSLRIEEVRDELIRGQGAQFDPHVVPQALSWMDDVGHRLVDELH